MPHTQLKYLHGGKTNIGALSFLRRKSKTLRSRLFSLSHKYPNKQ